jgi:threonine/homoserine/homoserine lactone efflux protein
MTFGGGGALFGTMVVLAAIPSVSVLAVSARSAASGFVHGALTTLGVVLGDVVFILLAVYGLAAIAELMGDRFVLVRYLGAAYLVWLGVVLWRSRPRADRIEGRTESSRAASVLTGLLITLGDQKAILFYLGILPAFLDLTAVSVLDAGLIVAIAAVAVAGPKLVYAYLAARAGRTFQSARLSRALNIVAGGVMIGVGVLLVARA